MISVRLLVNAVIFDSNFWVLLLTLCASGQQAFGWSRDFLICLFLSRDSNVLLVWIHQSTTRCLLERSKDLWKSFGVTWKGRTYVWIIRNSPLCQSWFFDKVVLLFVTFFTQLIWKCSTCSIVPAALSSFTKLRNIPLWVWFLCLTINFWLILCGCVKSNLVVSSVLW